MRRDGESELSCREPAYAPGSSGAAGPQSRGLSHPGTSSTAASISVSVRCHPLTHRKSEPLIAETQTIKPNPYSQNGSQPICPPQKRTYLIWKILKAYSWLSEIPTPALGLGDCPKTAASSMTLTASSSIISLKRAARLHAACYPQLHVKQSLSCKGNTELLLPLKTEAFICWQSCTGLKTQQIFTVTV